MAMIVAGACGLLAGLLVGLTSMGGVLVLPALVVLLGMTPHEAIPAAMASFVVPSAIALAVAMAQPRQFDLRDGDRDGVVPAATEELGARQVAPQVAAQPSAHDVLEARAVLPDPREAHAASTSGLSSPRACSPATRRSTRSALLWS